MSGNLSEKTGRTILLTLRAVLALHIATLVLVGSAFLGEAGAVVGGAVALLCLLAAVWVIGGTAEAATKRAEDEGSH